MPGVVGIDSWQSGFHDDPEREKPGIKNAAVQTFIGAIKSPANKSFELPALRLSRGERLLETRGAVQLICHQYSQYRVVNLILLQYVQQGKS